MFTFALDTHWNTYAYMYPCIYTYMTYSIKKKVRGRGSLTEAYRRILQGLLEIHVREKNTRSSRRDNLTLLAHIPVIPLNISSDVDVQSRSSDELSVYKITVYEMRWNWVEKFIPFRFTSTGTYEQDASFGNKIFVNVLKRRSFWASIKLTERPVSLLVWGNVNRYTYYKVM